MGKAKKLDLSFKELCSIAAAINKNTLDNKSRGKETKIPTDKFLKNNFGINRKDFSASIKETKIKYNPSKFRYDIPKNDYNNTTNTIEPKSITNEVQVSKAYVDTLKKNTEYKNGIEVLQEFQDMLPVLKKMIEWYKEQSNIINKSTTELNLNNEELKGAIGSHTLKCYETVYGSFNKLCAKKYKGYKKQDLVSLALLDFVKKYS